MRKIVLTFGLLAGAVLSATMLLSTLFWDHIGFDKGMYVGYTSMVLAFLMVWFGVRSYRDNAAGGRVSFVRAFVVGLLITLVASSCYVATWEVIYYNVSPDFMDKYSAYAIDQAKKSGASDAKLAQIRKEMADATAMYKNPLVNVAMTLLEPLPVGLLFTLVTAVAMSRRRRVGEPAVA